MSKKHVVLTYGIHVKTLRRWMKVCVNDSILSEKHRERWISNVNALTMKNYKQILTNTLLYLIIKIIRNRRIEG